MPDLTLENLTDAMNEEAPEVDENAQPETDAQNAGDGIDGGEGSELEESDGADGEDPDGEGDQPDKPELPEDQVIEWETAAGEKFSAPVSELKSGYMRNQDYTQKTQELAKERESAHQEIQQQFQTVGQYAQEVGALYAQNAYIGQLEASIQRVDRASDPVGYNAAVNELLLARQSRDTLAGQIGQIQQSRTVEQQKAFLAAQQNAAAELSKSIPGFGKELVQKLNETGHDYGFSDQELAMTTDPRYIRVLHDAMQFRALQSRKPAAVNRARQAPAKPARQTRSVPPSTIDKTLKSFNAHPSIEAMATLMSAAKK